MTASDAPLSLQEVEALLEDAWANLEGAIYDIERAGGDTVSVQTLKRVAGQIAKAQAALSKQEQG